MLHYTMMRGTATSAASDNSTLAGRYQDRLLRLRAQIHAAALMAEPPG